MSRSLIAVFAAGVIATFAVLPALADAAGSEPYLDSVVAAWRTDPVFVDQSQHLLVPGGEAARLEQRIQGHDPAIRIAVVPAVALSTMPGATDDARAIAFLEDTTDRFDRDGYFFVVFGGTGTYSGTIGVSPPAEEALLAQLGNFTRGEPAAMLHAVLDELGVPELPAEADPGGGASPLVFVVAGVTLAALGMGGFVVWRARRSAGHGPAPYRPSFEALPDERDTLAGRRMLAREDVTRFGEEISTADVPLDEPAAAADLQAAMDAYTQVSTAVDGEPDDLVLRAVQATSEYGRWRLACALARLNGEPLPPRRADCFFDARHGVSVTDWLYTPANGVSREVPVCAGCRDARSGAMR